MADGGGKGTFISTWFVADDASEGTWFPQLGMTSDAPAAQAAYWRCVAVFFVSSLLQNPHSTHVFFTNTLLPEVDGLSIAALLEQLGVEVVHLPITMRLPKGAVSAWGNQFYVFDVLRHVGDRRPECERLILLDSDMLWTMPVAPLEQAIDRHGVLTYTLHDDQHPWGEAISGVSRQQLARFVAAQGGEARESVDYHGGEFIAVDRTSLLAINAWVARLWDQVRAGGADVPREEAHLLSAIYALMRIPSDTANRFTRRMWTTFKVHDTRSEDLELAIWDLPAEKRTGFKDLFSILRRRGLGRAQVTELGLDRALYAATFGIPRRSLPKFLRDGARKVREKALAALPLSG